MSSMRKNRKRRRRSGRSSIRPTVVVNRSSTKPTAETDSPERLELEMTDLEAIIDRSKVELLNEQDCEQLHSVLETLLFVTRELEKKRVSVQRLKQLLFGATTEKTRKVLEKALDEVGEDQESDADDDSSAEKPPKEKAKGHGRNGADAYTGAEKVQIAHPTLKGGDDCPAQVRQRGPLQPSERAAGESGNSSAGGDPMGRPGRLRPGFYSDS